MTKMVKRTNSQLIKDIVKEASTEIEPRKIGLFPQDHFKGKVASLIDLLNREYKKVRYFAPGVKCTIFKLEADLGGKQPKTIQVFANLRWAHRSCDVWILVCEFNMLTEDLSELSNKKILESILLGIQKIRKDYT